MIRILKIIIYIAILIWLGFAAIFFGNAVLLSAVIVLALLPVVAELLFFAGFKRLYIAVDTEKYEILQDTELDIFIRATHCIFFGYAAVEFELKSIFYEGRTIQKILPLAPVLRVKSALKVKFEKPAAYRASINNVYVSDIFGIFRIKKDVDSSVNIDVMPLSEKSDIYCGNTEIDLCRAVNSYKASDGDMSAIRNYVRGDRLKSIHWKATAARDEIMVKEYERTGADEYIVLFDFNSHYIDKSFCRLKGVLEALVELGKGFYVMWLASGNEELSIICGEDKEDINNIIKTLYRSYPVYDENLTVNAFKKQFGESCAIYIGKYGELIQ